MSFVKMRYEVRDSEDVRGQRCLSRWLFLDWFVVRCVALGDGLEPTWTYVTG